jgi:hypothetical protein
MFCMFLEILIYCTLENEGKKSKFREVEQVVLGRQ